MVSAYYCLLLLVTNVAYLHRWNEINMPLVWSLNFLRGPPGPLLGPLKTRTPGPRLQLPSGIQDLPRAAG